MSSIEKDKTAATDDRGPGAEKVELEKRLDSNAKLEKQASKSDEKDDHTDAPDR